MQDTHSMKPQGVWEVRRTLAVPALTRAADETMLSGRLLALPGVRQVRADAKRRRVQVLYDARSSDYASLERTLNESGFPSANHPWARLKANLFQYLDTNSKENANAPAPPCCNKPPKP